MRLSVVFALIAAVLGFGGIADAAPVDHRPAPPSHLQVTQQASGKAVLRWAALKATKNRPRRGFKVYVNGTLARTVTSKSVTLTGQRANHRYAVTVYAYNHYGLSKPAHTAYKRGTVSTGLPPNCSRYDGVVYCVGG